VPTVYLVTFRTPNLHKKFEIPVSQYELK